MRTRRRDQRWNCSLRRRRKSLQNWRPISSVNAEPTVSWRKVTATLRMKRRRWTNQSKLRLVKQAVPPDELQDWTKNKTRSKKKVVFHQKQRRYPYFSAESARDKFDNDPEWNIKTSPRWKDSNNNVRSVGSTQTLCRLLP